MNRLFNTFLLALFLLAPLSARAEILPRTIIALYDERGDGIRTSTIHSMAEMPLNHLGLNVEYYDIHQPLPDIAKRSDVRGVLTWFATDTRVVKPETYVSWLEQAVQSGKKIVMLGNFGTENERVLRSSAMTRVLSQMGVRFGQGWVQNPLDVSYEYTTPKMVVGETPFNWTRPAYPVMRAYDQRSQVHLSVHRQKQANGDSDLIVTAPGGGFIAANYVYRTHERHDENVNQWMIDPFAFFRLAYATDDLPKPDTTTIAGRRIYYSHIDGDGWNNMAQLDEFRDTPTLTSQVILDKVVKPYPDMPVTLTVIAADIDPNEAAVDNSRKVAQEFYAQPQVEAGSHTYSHPFYWQFFQNGKWWQEQPYLSKYTHTTWKPDGSHAVEGKPFLPAGYLAPRAYAYEPFDINREVEGSIKELSPLLPAGKKIALITWSGNCSPWDGAIDKARAVGLQNINGGDSRSDEEYPGYASLAPIGKQVGKERQIYASSSNENTYTSLWSKDFFAYRYLEKTLRNSESPIRVKPLNIYYHLYAGERDASLNALRTNINFARSQEIAPLSTSHYTKVAEGFYSTQLNALSPNSWRVENRGSLQTIRFDQAAKKAVDFYQSKGVIGERHYQGSLYVYLDAAHAQPVITLKDNVRLNAPPEEAQPYLTGSRWLVSNLKRQENGLTFTAQGYGDGDMQWQVPSAGRYKISVNGQPVDTVDSDGRTLKFTIKTNAIAPVQVSISPAGTGGVRA